MAPRRKSKKRPRLTPEQRKERLAAAHEILMEQVETLTTSEGWRGMIAARAWLHRFSTDNLLRIMRQCENATDVRTYPAWKKVGRYVRPGQRGIRIVVPAPYRARDEEGNRLDDEDGNPLYRMGFSVETRFDISQTDGEPLPDVEQATPRLLTGAAPARVWDATAEQISAHGYVIERGETAPANGWVKWDTRTVRISDAVEDAHAVKTLVHELAHIVCEHETRQIPRAMCEVEAESVACLVTALVGLDSLPYSVPYVAGWVTDAKTAHASAEQVMTAADTIAAAIARAVPEHEDAHAAA